VNNASLVPALPRLIAGIGRHHHTWALIQRSHAFAAHLLREDRADLFWRFGIGSGRDANKFADLRWHPGSTGSPVLDEALAWVDCAVETELDIGDRTIFVAAIVEGGVNGSGRAMTANHLLHLASDEQRRRLDEERRRDETLDANAILSWRASIL
jgi:flavin reductase (DIM6/NTAB) family NADH-FMN oxidoreductase RutF